jgi:hypothetical protein
MKTLYLASILALSAATTFACNDEEDRVTPRNTAGTKSHAGTAGNDSGSGGDEGDGGTGVGVGGSQSSSSAGEAGAETGGTANAGAGAGAGAGGTDAGEAGAAGAAGRTGDGGAGGAPHVEPFELLGAYDDNYGGSFVITADTWASSAIVAYDNALNAAYTQFPADDLYNPNKFAKTVYTEPANDDSFYFCMVVFSAATLAEAQASTATADDSDPENGGCGGQFPWTKATKQ